MNIEKKNWTSQKQRNDIYFFDIPYRESGRRFGLFWAQYSEIKTKMIAGAHQIHRHARATI